MGRLEPGAWLDHVRLVVLHVDDDALAGKSEPLDKEADGLPFAGRCGKDIQIAPARPDHLVTTSKRLDPPTNLGGGGLRIAALVKIAAGLQLREGPSVRPIQLCCYHRDYNQL